MSDKLLFCANLLLNLIKKREEKVEIKVEERITLLLAEKFFFLKVRNVFAQQNLQI